jgi:acetyl-CoA C-acetyltransferase
MGISREAQDQLALNPRTRPRPPSEGRFKDEIVPVKCPSARAIPLVWNWTSIPGGATLEALAKLRPAFKKDGTVTAGNASGINDGAAALVVTSATRPRSWAAASHGLASSSYGWGGVDPSVMGLGPIRPAARPSKKPASRWTTWN